MSKIIQKIQTKLQKKGKNAKKDKKYMFNLKNHTKKKQKCMFNFEIHKKKTKMKKNIYVFKSLDFFGVFGFLKGFKKLTKIRKNT